MQEPYERVPTQPSQDKSGLNCTATGQNMHTVQNDDLENSLIERKSADFHRLDQREKKPQQFIWLLLISGIIMYTLYGNMGTFYPPYSKHNHPDISDAQIGLVIGMMYFGIFTGSIVASVLLSKFGRKNILLVGVLIMLVGTAGYGLLVLIDDDSFFFWTSFIFRIFQGFGDGFASTAIYSIIAIETKEDQALYLSLFSASVGLGALIGPSMGQIIFNQVGFAGTFYALSGVLAIALIMQLISVPNRVNQTEVPKKSYEGAKDITFVNLFKNRRSLMACISTTTGLIFIMFFLPVYAEYLEHDIMVDAKYIGFIFAILPGSFFLSAGLVGAISKKTPRIFLTQICFFSIPVSLILYGPSQVFDFPANLGLMLPGNVFLGISYAIMLVPMIAEIIDAVKDKEQVNKDDELTIGKISDLASGLFGCFNALGNFLAPIIGGLLRQQIGFRSTCDILALSSLIYGVIYFGVNTVPYIIETRKKKQQQ